MVKWSQKDLTNDWRCAILSKGGKEMEYTKEIQDSLYEALKLYQEHQKDTGGHYCWKCAEAINKALAKAEGRKDDQIPMDTNMASTRKKMRYL